MNHESELVWQDQEEDQQRWATITNKEGTTIYIVPRLYLIQLSLRPGKRTLQVNDELEEKIKHMHNHNYAPEPLRTTRSDFQILDQKNGSERYISLTNISSQIIRRELIKEVLEYHLPNYKIHYTWIWTKTIETTPTMYNTKTISETINCITTRQTDLFMYKEMNVKKDPPIKFKMTVILHHICRPSNKIDQINQRTRENENQQKRKAIQTRNQENSNLWKRRKAINQQRQQQQEQQQQQQQNPNQQEENSIVVYSQNPTAEEWNLEEASQHSYHSIMQAIGTSHSTQTNLEETETEQENASLNFIMPQLEELQKYFKQHKKLNVQERIFSIVSATVSEQSVCMEIKYHGNTQN